MTQRGAFFIAAACALSGAFLVAQQTQAPQLTFRVETNYIEVDAVVTDAQGRFVRDLKRDEFEVLEDRRAQKVDLFALVDIPLERADRPLYRPTPITPDVATNAKEFEGRIYVLLLDANHVPPTDSYLVKKAALRFIDQYIGSNDLAAVVLAQTGSRDDNQEFTSSKPALRAAVEKFIGEKPRSRALAVRENAIQKQGLEKVGIDMLDAKDPEAIERVAKARGTLDSITRLSNYISGIRGRRKAVVLFSEGLDYNLEDTIGPRSRAGIGESAVPRNPVIDNSPIEAIHAAGILESMQTMFEAASRANVAIYSVDPRGVASEMDTLIQTTGMPEVSQIGIESVTFAAREELRRQVGTLRTFSEATGGLALVGTNDFDGGFRRLVEDNSAYYVLGYNAGIKRDGKFHEITVRVKRPGVQVRARRGYYAAKETKPVTTPPDPTTLLLNSPMPVGGLGLRLTTTTLKGTGKNVKVLLTVEVDGRQITIADRNGTFATKVDLTYAAVDMSANVKASGRKSLDLAIVPETRKSIAEYGLRLVTEFELPPGQYQLRLAGHEPVTGQAGSIFWDLQIPDFTKSQLSMGSLGLSSSRAGRTPTSPDAPSLKGLMPGPPTANRTFTLEETLAVFAEIYDSDDRLHTLDVTATVRTDDGTQVFVTRDEVSTRDAAMTDGRYRYLARIPLQDLVPGQFVLTVEAKSRLGGDPAVRETQITIK